MSRLITTIAAIAATTLMSSTAFAGCNNGTSAQVRANLYHLYQAGQVQATPQAR